MKSISFDNGERLIAITNMEGELLTELRINMKDGSIEKRFYEVIEKLEILSDEVGKTQETLLKKYSGVPEDDMKLQKEAVSEITAAKKEYIESIIAEIDYIFGKDTIHNVFRRGYEMNEEYFPDLDAIMSFVEGIIPIMNDLFGERFKALEKKYNVGRKGSKK